MLGMRVRGSRYAQSAGKSSSSARGWIGRVGIIVWKRRISMGGFGLLAAGLPG
jgi:hypothetical protein